tara:strand:- start:51047 stop:51517 length:471 start_codon:yes stop_codon:yes gene_type:complete
MKTRFLTFVLSTVFLLTANHTFAQDGVGLGGELASPTGLSYKVPINASSAITGAWGVFLTDGFTSSTFEVNYLMYRENENFNIGSGNLSPYIGGGLSFVFRKNADAQVALRVPFGIEYKIDNAPIEIYMDIGPYLVVTDPLSYSFDSSLGFRYRFK